MLSYQLRQGASVPADLFRFRYAIYVEEMGRKQKYACAETRTIRDPLDELGYQGIVALDDAIIGCIRMNFLRDGSIGDYFSLYGLSALSAKERETASICTRLMIGPSARRTQVSIELIKFAYAFGLDRGIDTCFIDCNDHLVRFFERFGWRFLFKREHEDYGLVNIMRLDLRDHNHLAAIKSPFLALGQPTTFAFAAE